MLSDAALQQAISLERAKALRARQTSGEKALWQKIRAKRFHGYKFRRQVPIGPFIVDFLCVEHMLVIEIDGRTHFEEGVEDYDKKREEYLRQHGFNVVRFKNMDTVQSIDIVLQCIRKILDPEYEKAS